MQVLYRGSFLLTSCGGGDDENITTDDSTANVSVSTVSFTPGYVKQVC